METSFKVVEEIKDVLTEQKNVQSVEDTKICPRCGRKLPMSSFAKRAASKDGRQVYCRDCASELNYRRRNELKALASTTEEVNGKNMSKVFSNPDLARFTPRQLMEELKARGFKWEYMLEPQRKIMYDKI